MNACRFYNLIVANTVVLFLMTVSTSCNPVPQSLMDPMMAVPAMPYGGMLGYQYDPYSAMQVPDPYMYGPQFAPMGYDSNRRSLSGMFRPGSRSSSKESRNNQSQTDEQKALEGLPVSFVSNQELETNSQHDKLSINILTLFHF